MLLSEIEFHFGAADPWRTPFDGDRFRSFHAGPGPVADAAATVLSALTQPADFPPLASMCVPGDHVALALDRALPAAAAVVGEIIQLLRPAGVEPENITILQTLPGSSQPVRDPRQELAENVRDLVQWKVHDPALPDRTGYLATSVSGERIYLNRDLLEADVVIPLYRSGFDSIIGYRSPGGLLYPAFSQEDAIRKTLGEGHPELRPDSDRPLRQLGEEICWLMGLQFAVGVVPSRVAERPAAVFGGQFEAVQRQSQKFLNHAWTVPLDRRAEAVVISVAEPAERVGWEEIGRAAALGQNLVVRDGRIIVLSSLNAALTPGLDMLRSSRSPKTALQRMRKELPPDLLECTQLASAASWAKVSLLSRLDSSLVDDLHLTPLNSIEEAARFIAPLEDIVLIDGGAHMWGEIVAE